MESQRSFSDITRRLIVFTVATLLTACGGGGGGGYGGGGGGGGGGTTYTISGTVIGLASAGSVVLQDNGGDNLPVSANGAFTFATPVNAFAAYNVTVLTQPANGQVCAVTNNSGAGYALANVDTVRVSCASVFTFAGSGVSGLGDAPGEEAVFYGPSGAAMDAAGNIYVADYYNNVVRKITSAGAVSTLAGSGLAGYTDATGTAAQFHLVINGASVAGAAVDAAGNNVYVADTGNNVIRKVTSAGVVTTLAGSGTPGFTNATGNAAQFNSPQGVAVDGAGNVYVADTSNNAIRKITSGGVVTTLAGSGVAGFTNATGTAAQFRLPDSVAVDAAGNVYVADTNNNAIRKITPAGVVSTLAGSGGSGYKDATGTAALFSSPQGIAVDAAGNVYVADSGNGVVRVITSAGVVSTLAGGSGLSYQDGAATTARFYNLQGIAVDGSGNVYAADWGNRRIRKISALPYTYTVGGYVVGLGSGATLVLQNNGGDNLTISANGVFRFATALTTATSYGVTVLTQPAGPACTVTNGAGSFTAGNVFTVKINCALVSTLAGSGTAGYTDATGASAQFRVASVLSADSTGVAVDGSGNVYVADTFNNVIRKITSAGAVTTLAGSTAGTSGYVDATGTAARFFQPRGVAVDGSGNVYVGDTGNNAIRKIVIASAVVTTLAGSTFGNLNGTGTAAKFEDPSGVAVDASGNVYVADSTNAAIRKISPAGVVTTLAGSPQTFQQAGYLDSTGTGAAFRSVAGVAVDAAGTVYVADYINCAIRVINPAGTVTTLAGSAVVPPGYMEGNGAVALFHFPGAVAVDASGTLYVVDDSNNVVRKIVQ